MLFVFCVSINYAQSNKLWKSATTQDVVRVSKTAQRDNFPQEFKLFQLNLETITQNLLSATDRVASNSKSITITLPNSNGNLERFKMLEASNFEADLQAQFPLIRAYIGVGIDDKNAQVRLSLDPNGIQAMIFRTDKRNEFIEQYSENGSVYAVFNSSRIKGALPFTCTTEDVEVLNTNKNATSQLVLSSNGVYKTLRLALSCTAEYSNYFGANSSANVGLVLAAFNASMTRVNGVFEKDLAMHMNIISANNVIYYNPATDPYSDSSNMGNWNGELQSTLTAVVTEANYDVGHLFGATGGGGNAGCIGCVCVNGSKGSGITSPSNGVPAGDTFDIDYVAHELGHQFGGNHTFSHSSENNSVNVEPGSGSTIMGYAGITGTTDVQSNSDDYFTYRSILQIQSNLIGKTCPVSTLLTTLNQTPVINAGLDYTIPKSTPFKLTGTGTDADGNTLSYGWEQNDDANGTNVGATQSFPSPTKTNGPNFRSFDPVSTPVRYFPALASVLNNTLTTTWEALSSVARTLNFTLTGRDNVTTYAQTSTDNMIVTVSGTTGPFDVTSQSTTGITWQQGETKDITWAVNNANTLSGSANVDILLSTDGGLTFPTVLIANVPNDGLQSITVPNVTSQTCRVMVKPTGNVFYDINTKNFYIGYTISNSCATYSNNTPFALPDGSSSFTTRQIAVPTSPNLISDVNITLNITHPNISQVQASFVKPSSSAQVLFSTQCVGNADLNVTFDAQGTTLVCANPTQGIYIPTSNYNMNLMNGTTQQGNWNFAFRDNVAGQAGTVNSITLEICSQVIQLTLANDSFAFQNLSVYPNPNDGTFSVQFNSSTNDKIAIGVYDMRGREIFNKSYNNNGLFNETLQLNDVQSGVYLVNILDGDRKITKKIVVE